ncbi:hypothetical protein EV426DRAFT_702690 [Tirmania nivea]|nr:hypothetical protein EV426DRAFT_702690 [Tirmania nivea]
MLDEDIPSLNTPDDSTDNASSSDQIFREASPGDRTDDVPNSDQSFREASPDDHTSNNAPKADQSFREASHHAEEQSSISISTFENCPMRIIKLDWDWDTDDMEYLAYNTTDNEDNNTSDLSSIPASDTDGDNSDNIKTNNKGINNEEDHAQASKLYRETLDQIFANPDLEEVDRILESSNDNEDDEDYARITSDDIVY